MDTKLLEPAAIGYAPPSVEVPSPIDELSAERQRRTDRERENLDRDLMAALKRLKAGEYAATDFLDRDVFDVPQRTREYYLYSQSLLEMAGRVAVGLEPLLDGVARVVDLCPGWVPKVPMALHRLSFRGRVVAVDRDAEALQALGQLSALFAPQIDLKLEARDVFDGAAAPVGELVVANHLIDDALVSTFGPGLDIEPDLYYRTEAGLAGAGARLVAHRAEILAGFPARLALALARFVAPSGRLMLSDYPSYLERLVGVEPAVLSLRAEVLQQVATALEAQGFLTESQVAVDRRLDWVLARR